MCVDEKSTLEQDPEYFNKVNAEYEAIKKNILAKSSTSGDYDNLQKLENEPTGISDALSSDTAVPKPRAVNPQLASMLSPQLTSSFYDNLNENVVQVQTTTSSTAAPPLYDNLTQIQPIDTEKTLSQEPVVYKMDDLVCDEMNAVSGMTRSELDELIDKINDMQTLSRDDYPTTTTSTGNLAGGAVGNAGDTSILSNLSSNSSINSLNRIEEFAKSVSEKFASQQVEQSTPQVELVKEDEIVETSQILNDIIQQVMTAQEQVKLLEEQEQPSAAVDFTWENLMNPQDSDKPTTEPLSIESTPQNNEAMSQPDESELEKNFNWETLMQSSPAPSQPLIGSDNLETKCLDEISLIKPQGNSTTHSA